MRKSKYNPNKKRPIRYNTLEKYFIGLFEYRKNGFMQQDFAKKGINYYTFIRITSQLIEKGIIICIGNKYFIKRKVPNIKIIGQNLK